MLESLNGLPLMRLHFAFRTTTPLSLYGYTGSTWHGALGHALSEAAPEAFDCLYRAAAGDDAPRPFALLPHAGPTELAPGDWLGLSLTLAGPAVALSREVMFAMEHLGARGLGNQHVPLALSGVGCERADGEAVAVLGPAGTMQAQALIPVGLAELAAIWSGLPARRVALRFDTRLRMKAGNGLMDTAPPLRLLLQRLLERVSALMMLYGAGAPLPDDGVRTLLRHAESVEVEGHDLRWEEWGRISGRSGQHMPWGGLVGEVRYRGDLTPLLPWLALGEWLHVGAKTTFGLGHYSLLAAPR